MTRCDNCYHEIAEGTVHVSDRDNALCAIRETLTGANRGFTRRPFFEPKANFPFREMYGRKASFFTDRSYIDVLLGFGMVADWKAYNTRLEIVREIANR